MHYIYIYIRRFFNFSRAFQRNYVVALNNASNKKNIYIYEFNDKIRVYFFSYKNSKLSLSRCVFSTGYRYVLVCSLKKMRNVHFDYCLFFMSSHFHYRNLIEPAYRDILDINDVLVDVSLELLRRIIS